MNVALGGGVCQPDFLRDSSRSDEDFAAQDTNPALGVENTAESTHFLLA